MCCPKGSNLCCPAGYTCVKCPSTGKWGCMIIRPPPGGGGGGGGVLGSEFDFEAAEEEAECLGIDYIGLGTEAPTDA